MLVTLGAMALDDRQLGAVGFIFPENPNKGVDPIGTFFAVFHVLSGQPMVFLCTARHVVDGIGDTYAVMRDEDRKPVGWKLEERRWFFHSDSAIDVAIQPLWRPAGVTVKPLSVWDMTLTSHTIGHLPKHGVTVYFAGLHIVLPQTWQDLIPLVRSATLAAPSQSGITWGDENRHVDDEEGRIEGFTHVDDWVPLQLVTATGPNPLLR